MSEGPGYGRDGFAHLTYYDRGSLLSFVYDPGTHPGTIGVHHGGYGEPLVDVFAWSTDRVVNLEEFFVAFTSACRAYASAWRRSQTVEHFDGEAT